MNNKAISFLRNFSYTLSSNLIALLISTIVTLVVPKLIGVEEYGYWQLYLFYSSYVGFLHFGWNDGIYLKYGGKEYNKLDRQVFFSQFYMLAGFQILLSILIIILTYLFALDSDKSFIIKATAICMVIMNVRGMLIYIFQGTNKIREYAKVTMIDRISYCALIIIFLAFGVREYKVLIFADLIGKCFSLFIAMYWGRSLVWNKISTFQLNFEETLDNTKIGIRLMFANIASMLIIGVVRFGIEYSWGVETFGKVSLTLSISNLMMLFINAVGLIMFPILRRTDESKLANIYVTIKDFLMIMLLGVLLCYYPLKVILSTWLPNYSDSLVYMALVFPMCLFEGKMALLVNTYLKTLREEKTMLRLNLISLMLSLVLTFVTTIVLNSLNLAILSIVLVLMFRCYLAEIYLAKLLKISVFKDSLLELIMTIIFITTAWFGEMWVSMSFYVIMYCIYLIIKKKDISRMICNLKLLMQIN